MCVCMYISVDPCREGHGGPGANRPTAEPGGNAKGHSGFGGEVLAVQFGILNNAPRSVYRGLSIDTMLVSAVYGDRVLYPVPQVLFQLFQRRPDFSGTARVPCRAAGALSLR